VTQGRPILDVIIGRNNSFKVTVKLIQKEEEEITVSREISPWG
jgi:hypothetical protein